MLLDIILNIIYASFIIAFPIMIIKADRRLDNEYAKQATRRKWRIK